MRKGDITMAKKLDKVEVVTVGVGWTGGIIAAELAKAGYQVLGLERGVETSLDDYNQIKDELKYNPRNEMMDDLSDATLTFRNNLDTEALPIRDNGNLRIEKIQVAEAVTGLHNTTVISHMIMKFTVRLLRDTGKIKYLKE